MHPPPPSLAATPLRDSQADAECEFQRERYNRLVETADWQRAELARTVAQKEKLADDLIHQQSAHRDAVMAKEVRARVLRGRGGW